MQKDVFLIGFGQTKFGEWWDKSLRDLMEEAVARAVEDAQCLSTDIDVVIVAAIRGALHKPETDS